MFTLIIAGCRIVSESAEIMRVYAILAYVRGLSGLVKLLSAGYILNHKPLDKRAYVRDKESQNHSQSSR